MSTPTGMVARLAARVRSGEIDRTFVECVATTGAEPRGWADSSRGRDDLESLVVLGHLSGFGAQGLCKLIVEAL